MKIQKRSGFNLDPILKQLSKVRTLNADGSASMAGLGVLDEFESYLKTACHAEGISDAFIGRVVKKAMMAEQELDEAKFIKHARKIGSKLNQTGRKPLKVVFPIWGSNRLLGSRRQWGDVRISFDVSPKSQFVRRALRERASQIAKRGKWSDLELKAFSNLPLAICNVRAVDSFDAFELAERAISIELGLYSLMESRGRTLFGIGINSKPIGNMLLAPHMTVHAPTGALSSDVFWFNEWSSELTEVSRTQKDIDRIQKNVEHVRNRIRKLPRIWRVNAELALARHYEAFSQKDLEASFLDGWRLLEAIGGHSREKSETLVKRASYFFHDPVERNQFGLHLMHRRNLISHGRPIRAEDNEGLAFQMKAFLTPMLHAFLTNPFNLKDIQEFWELCDLPTNQVVRARKLHLLECSAKFRKEQ